MFGGWSLLQLVLWYYGIAALFVFRANLYYCRALLRGIACARDEQHRMTPESPWYYFEREFTSHGFRIMIGLIAWLYIASCIVLYREIYYAFVYGQGFVDLLPILYHPIFLGMLEITGFSIAVITLLAPRFDGAITLTALGTLIATMPHSCFLILEAGMGLNVVGSKYRVFMTGLGLTAVLVGWLYVRFKLDRAWFRFDD